MKGVDCGVEPRVTRSFVMAAVRRPARFGWVRLLRSPPHERPETLKVRHDLHVAELAASIYSVDKGDRHLARVEGEGGG